MASLSTFKLARDDHGQTDGVTVLASDGRTTTHRLGYDPTGHLSWFEDARGARTGIERDANGIVRTMVDADSHVTSYGYDGYGRLASVTSPNGAELRAYYDLGGRVARVSQRLE